MYKNRVVEKSKKYEIYETDITSARENTFVRIKARVVYSRVKQTEDKLGSREKLVGVLEDRGYRAFFVSYNPRLPLLPNNVVFIENAYVVVKDGRKIFILNDRSRVEVLSETLDKYIWRSKISDLNTSTENIILSGKIYKVLRTVVKRCLVCGKIIKDKCPDGHEGYSYDLRLTFILDDGDKIKCIAGRNASAELLKIPISVVYDAIYNSDSTIVFNLNLNDDISVFEYETFEKIGKYFFDEKTGKVILLSFEDKLNLDIKPRYRRLNLDSFKDRTIFTDIFSNYLERSLSKSGLDYFLGIYIIKSWRGEGKTICGFKINYDILPKSIKIECIPVVKSYRSVHEYIIYRRKGGASYNSIKKALIHYHNLVYLYPHGIIGKIEDIIPIPISQYRLNNNISLYDYWLKKGLKLDPSMRPIIRVRVYEYNLILDYPASLVYHQVDVNSYSGFHHIMIEKTREKIVKLLSQILDQTPYEYSVERGYNIEYIENISKQLIGRMVTLQGDVVVDNGYKVFFAKKVLE